jgi:hypothetical protein
MKTNIGVQILIVLGSAIAMYLMSYVGKLQSKKENYNPSLIPSLNLVASALLTTMLISEEFENTVNNFNWIAGISVLFVLVGCNYLSPDNLSSLTLQIESTDIKHVVNDWKNNLNEQDIEAYWGQDNSYQNKIIQQLTHDLENGVINKNVITVKVDYDESIEEGDDANELKVVRFIQRVLGSKYSVSATINNSSGVSFGLAVAVLVNFIMDGLLVGNEVKYDLKQSGFLKQGYMKLNNIFGFIFDNLILMLILGFQFSQSSLSKMKQMLYLGLIVLSFVISMFLGMFTPISTNINKSIANTIVFVVIAYTILIELLPESSTFKDYFGRYIEIENKEDPYMLVHDSFYLKNYKKAFMPIILFGVFFLYKTMAGFLD